MIGAVVDEVLKEMGNATDEGMKAADDYMDTETGFLICGKCHTKKQKKISFLGEERIVCCLCQCAAEGMEKEREKHRAEEELLRIRQMKSAGLQDKTFYNYTFERCDASQENAIYAKRYVEHFSEMVQTGQVVLVYKCGQKKLNNLYYQVKEQRRRSTWRKTKNLTLRNLNNRLWICIMPEEPRIHNWNVNMA